MLRTVFVGIIIIVGVFYAAQGPFYALLFYLWNAYFRPELWVWGGVLNSLHLSVTIAIYLVVTSLLSGRAFVISPRIGLLLAFFVQTLLSTLFSEHFAWSWTYWIDFAKIVLICYLIVVLVTDRDRFRLTMLVIAYSVGFECAKQAWVELLLNPGGQNNNVVAFLGDNNGVALGTMMLVPLFGALVRTATSRSEAFVHRFFLVGVFMRGITTYSRGGFVAAGVIGLHHAVPVPAQDARLGWHRGHGHPGQHRHAPAILGSDGDAHGVERPIGRLGQGAPPLLGSGHGDGERKASDRRRIQRIRTFVRSVRHDE